MSKAGTAFRKHRCACTPLDLPVPPNIPPPLWDELYIAALEEAPDQIIRLNLVNGLCLCYNVVALRNYHVHTHMKEDQWVDPLTGAPFTVEQRSRIKRNWDRTDPSKPSGLIYSQNMALASESFRHGEMELEHQ